MSPDHERSKRCAAAGWRPAAADEECRLQAAAVLGEDLAAWLSASTSTEWSVAASANLLFVAAQPDCDGYFIARRLEDGFAIQPDAQLVALLDEWAPLLERVTKERELSVARELGIALPFKVAAAARAFGADGVGIPGIAFRIPECEVGVVAFVPDAEAFDRDTGDLIVLMVDAEDLEVVGKPPQRAVNLRIAVFAKLDGWAEENAVRELDSLADSDLRAFDEEVVSMSESMETSGAMTRLDAFQELAENAGSAVARAVEDGSDEDVWIYALLHSALTKRIAMIAGKPTGDMARVRRLLWRLEDVQEDLSGAAVSGAVPVLLH